MKINRALVKQQAKIIIKGKVFPVFIVTFVVMLLCNMSVGINFIDFGSSGLELFRDNNNESNYNDYNSDYYGHDYDNPIDSFEGTSVGGTTASASTVLSSLNGTSSGVSSIITLIFSPLYVTMAGMYLALIRRSPSEDFALGHELGGIFKKTFNETYFKKLILELLVGVIGVVLMFLLVFPAVIFIYSAYFSREILSDNPDLKPSEALRLSKKMIRGSRTELFALDLSFVPWFLLCVVTCGIALIYVAPYYRATRALYYENFRMRALQQGKITADDFLSFEEKMNNYSRNAQQPGGQWQYNPHYGSEPFGNAPYSAPSEPRDYYYTPPTDGNSQQNNAAPYGSAPQDDYYTPPQPAANEPTGFTSAPDQNNGYPYTDMPHDNTPPADTNE